MICFVSFSPTLSLLLSFFPIGHVCWAPSSKKSPRQLLQRVNAFVLASDGLAASLPLFQGTEPSPYGSRAFNNFCVGGKAG